MALQVLTAGRRAGGSLQATRTISIERQFMKNLLMRFWKEEEGQDLTEYALVLVLLSLAAVGSLKRLANEINGTVANADVNLRTEPSVGEPRFWCLRVGVSFEQGSYYGKSKTYGTRRAA